MTPPHSLTLSALSNSDKKRIHGAALQILEEIGMRIVHDEALSLLERAGCRIKDDNRVEFPASLVEAALESCPQNIRMYDREGNPAMDLGGRRAYFGTGSDLIYTLDHTTHERRESTSEDVVRAVRVADALPNLDFVMSMGLPSDAPTEWAYAVSFKAMVENSTKPIVTTADRRADLTEMWELARIIRSDEEAVRAKPYFAHYVEPISPLHHPFESLDKLLFCAEKGVPVTYSPAPIAGATAPMTMAGHVALGLAECFAGLVVHQLKAKGAPFILGMGPAVLDMATTQCSYGAPEYYLSYMAFIEMTHFYDRPSWGYAGATDSQIPDGQAVLEAAYLSAFSTMLGANLNHDVGYTDFGRAGSLELVVITNELIDQLRRMQRGIPVDDKSLALDVIREVGPGGHFTGHEHTLVNFRDVQWRPKLLNREGFDNWKRAGSSSLTDRAGARVVEILENHRPAPLPEAQAEAINSRMDVLFRDT